MSTPDVTPVGGQPDTIHQAAGDAFARLAQLVHTLRGPDGCPWDQAQTRESVSPFLVEETYEVMDALRSGDGEEIKEELGDLLFQVLFHADMSRDDKVFDIAQVVERIYQKMVDRHPHVFGDETADTAEDVLRNWDRIKAREPGKQARKSVLDGVPASMPSLLRAHQTAKRAARAGFDWDTADGVWNKLYEELDELKEAVASGTTERATEELGDVLFTVANLGRKLELSSEDALSGAVNRFRARFAHMEAAAPGPLNELDAHQWQALWQQAKDAQAATHSPEQG